MPASLGRRLFWPRSQLQSCNYLEEVSEWNFIDEVQLMLVLEIITIHLGLPNGLVIDTREH